MTTDAAPPTAKPFATRDLLLYFLGLGTTGFGGPVALVGYMQRDLVERRGWYTPDEYREGLALAQLAPGPLAAQLAMYLGWARGGAVTAALVGLAFVLPSFVMVLAIGIGYLRLGGLPWMQGAFYGIGAAVIAIIVRSATKLTRLTLGKDRLLWALFAGETGASGPERTYRVRPGDTLWSIAERTFPGDPREGVWELRERNELDSSVIVPGQVIVLPA